jgi:N4-gp56 family major capsid protein
MATTAFGTNHALAVKVWSNKLFHEALKSTWIYKFIGTGSDSLIQTLTDTQKGPGDTIYVGLRTLLSGAGVQGDGVLEGNEEAMNFYRDALTINQLRHAVRSEGKMSEQRIPYSVREEAMMGLKDWWADRMDTAFFNQICGNTGQADTKYTGNNATTAPDADHIVYMNGLTTEAQIASASASNAMKLTYINTLVEKAKTISPKIRPLRINGEEKYVMFLHPYQVTDLRNNTSTGEWLDIQKAAIQGGNISKNPIYTGALGEYNGTVLHESTRVQSVTAGVYRAVLCGAQSAVIGFGQNGGPNKMTWQEELFDYKNQLGVAGGLIWGMKKTVFNSADFGSIVLPTYAASHG